MRIPFVAPLSILALGVAFALPARAEEAGDSDLEKKLKEQIQRVLQLMQKNEDALLKASTQGGKAPEGPEVPVPPPGEQGGAGASGQGSSGQGSSGQGSSGQGSSGQGSSGQGGPGGSGGNAGEGAKASLDELLKALREGGGAIPTEIENLIKMMPT